MASVREFNLQNKKIPFFFKKPLTNLKSRDIIYKSIKIDVSRCGSVW